MNSVDQTKLLEIYKLIEQLDQKLCDLLNYDSPLYDQHSVDLANIWGDLSDHYNYDPNGPE